MRFLRASNKAAYFLVDSNSINNPNASIAAPEYRFNSLPNAVLVTTVNATTIRMMPRMVKNEPIRNRRSEIRSIVSGK